MDCVLLMAKANIELNLRLREALKPELHTSYRYLCAPSNPMTSELFGGDLPKAVRDITDTNRITSKLSRETKQSFKRSRSDGHSDRYQGKYRNKCSWPSKNYRRPPFNKKERGEEGSSKEPELNHDQNIEVRHRDLQVAGRVKYFLSVWMDITSDRKILDMVKHCHLEFTENPYQHYPKPRIKFNSDEAAITCHLLPIRRVPGGT